MRNLLAVCSLLLVTLAAVAAQTEEAPVPDDPVFVPSLASAPTASAADARPHFDGRVAPAAAVATSRAGAARPGSCEYAEPVRLMQRGPARRAIAWLFRGRRRC